MSKPNSICRVCGKQYDLCKTCQEIGIFHYKNVCCSKECFQKYLEQHNIKENGTIVDKSTKTKSKKKKESTEEITEVTENITNKITDKVEE